MESTYDAMIVKNPDEFGKDESEGSEDSLLDEYKDSLSELEVDFGCYKEMRPPSNDALSVGIADKLDNDRMYQPIDEK